MPLATPPIARTAMRTRRPVGEVFEAFVDPSGFAGSDDQQVTAIDSMGGFSFTLAACKAWLEHGIELNIVADHSPAGGG